MRVQTLADGAEAAYHRLRFAAGISGSGGGAPDATGGSVVMAAGAAPSEAPGAAAGAQPSVSGGAHPVGGGGHHDSEGDTAYRAPDPEPIVARFRGLEGELAHVEGTLGDYEARLRLLSGERARLGALSQPCARDAGDEDGNDLGGLDELRARVEGARRTRGAVRRGAAEVALLRLRLEQSVSVLGERLGALGPHVPPPPPDSLPPGLADADRSVAALLRRAHVGMPTEWSAGMHDRLAGVVTRLQALLRHTHVSQAAEAFLHSAQWLAAHVLAPQPQQYAAAASAASSSPVKSSGGPSSGSPPADGAPSPSPAGASTGPGGRKLIPSLGHRQASARLILERQGSAMKLGAVLGGATPTAPSPVLPHHHHQQQQPLGGGGMGGYYGGPGAAGGSLSSRPGGGGGGGGASDPVPPGSSILGELPESPLFTRNKGPLDEATRALDARFDATIEGLVGRNAHVVRVRPGSGGRLNGGGGGGRGAAHGGGSPPDAPGGRAPGRPKPVTRKAIGEALNAFERSWREGPPPEEDKAAEKAFASLHAKSESESSARKNDRKVDCERTPTFVLPSAHPHPSLPRARVCMQWPPRLRPASRTPSLGRPPRSAAGAPARTSPRCCRPPPPPSAGWTWRRRRRS